jgi:anti-anti-sigma factor
MLIYHHLGVWKHGDAIVVRFGDHQILDEFVAKKIAEELYEVADRADCRYLVLDFSGVLGLSTLMLGRLLTLRKKMASKGGRLVLCDMTSEVEEVLTTMKLNEIIEIMGTEADALKALGSS